MIDISNHIVNTDTKTFVLLKYKILTSDDSTWHLCETYPESVRKAWAWRCAEDVEHFAKGYSGAEEFIRIAKLYRDGLATQKELDKAWHEVPYPTSAYHAANAAYAQSAYYAAAANHAAYAAYRAGNCYPHNQGEEKWKLYISWLIEELCEYESSLMIDK